MVPVTLSSETDLAGWRQAARALRSRGVRPEEAAWSVRGSGGDLFGAPPLPTADGPAFTTPRAFVDLAEKVILHRSPDRFALLYRMLWRLGGEPHLMQIHSDPDVQAAQRCARAVSQAAHKMKAFVRFRQVSGPDDTEAYVAWFEPPHRVAELTAPFFVRRFATMPFSILTPDACIHWDTRELAVLPGADRSDAPSPDALEEYWRTYYASIFNPARLKVGAMQKEMPKRYWGNLPEARLIPELIAQAEARTNLMVGQEPSVPARRVVHAAPRAAIQEAAPTSLDAVRASLDACRRCGLHRDATVAVAGEGPQDAPLMVVGEQPGDQEDLAGRPFVGPAGQLLDRALAQAGVPRDRAYVTNAVKHFKHELRGKRRLHRTPDAAETAACRVWLEGERGLVRPRVILALGATAALAVFGRPVAIGQARGQAHALDDGAQGLVTWHPSYLLRLPDPKAKERIEAEFVADLATAWRLAAA